MINPRIFPVKCELNFEFKTQQQWEANCNSLKPRYSSQMSTTFGEIENKDKVDVRLSIPITFERCSRRGRASAYAIRRLRPPIEDTVEVSTICCTRFICFVWNETYDKLTNNCSFEQSVPLAVIVCSVPHFFCKAFAENGENTVIVVHVNRITRHYILDDALRERIYRFYMDAFTVAVTHSLCSGNMPGRQVINAKELRFHLGEAKAFAQERIEAAQNMGLALNSGTCAMMPLSPIAIGLAPDLRKVSFMRNVTVARRR